MKTLQKRCLLMLLALMFSASQFIKTEVFSEQELVFMPRGIETQLDKYETPFLPMNTNHRSQGSYNVCLDFNDKNAGNDRPVVHCDDAIAKQRFTEFGWQNSFTSKGDKTHNLSEILGNGTVNMKVRLETVQKGCQGSSYRPLQGLFKNKNGFLWDIVSGVCNSYTVYNAQETVHTNTQRVIFTRQMQDPKYIRLTIDGSLAHWFNLGFTLDANDLSKLDHTLGQDIIVVDGRLKVTNILDDASQARFAHLCSSYHTYKMLTYLAVPTVAIGGVGSLIACGFPGNRIDGIGFAWGLGLGVGLLSSLVSLFIE